MQRRRSTLKWEPEGSAPYLLGRAARLFVRRADDRLRKLGFSAAYVPVLRALKDGSALSQTALAERAKVEQPTMAKMLARMERDRVVRRTRNPEDGRSSLYSLTQGALAKVAQARRVLVLGGEEMLRGLTPAEIDQLGALLGRVVANLE
jgi:MarR family transcriptional regulator, transcriptional regulator for hemolysin